MTGHSTATAIRALENAAPRWTVATFGVLRSVIRSVGFILVLVLAAADYMRTLCFYRRSEPLRRQALWLQRWSRIVLRLIGLELHHRGTPPSSGMIVSNHLSYLDILAYSALVPCVFIAKKEVASWPVLGLFARMCGTIFVDRTRRMKVASANQRISEALRAGMVVVLFAEGTSSDGRTVLPFRSSLLEPATLALCPVAPAAIGYHLDDGSVPDEVCYWRDMTLLPHLLHLFAKRAVRAHVAFGGGEAEPLPLSRKNAARQLHRHVARLVREHQSEMAAERNPEDGMRFVRVQEGIELTASSK
jgi:1-acyl-sn-glycerol-3-phosphate acyltransferase